MDKKIIIFFAFFAFFFSESQRELFHLSNGGLFGGLSISAGTHVLRFGLSFHAFVVYHRWEIKSEQRFYVNSFSWGPPVPSLEWISSWGVSGGWGYFHKENMSPLYRLYASRSGYPLNTGYAINFYFTTNGTTQRTGTVWITHKKFSFFTENDLLAQKALDRFRTGAFGFSLWPDASCEIFLKNILWTGKYGRRQSISHPHFRLGCYLDTLGGKYIRYSSGTLCVGVQWVNSSFHSPGFSMGTDSEHIRDFVQNKMIHDMIFLPKAWLRKSRNCHMPMINDSGNLYLFEKENTPRHPKLFFQLSANEFTFY